MTVQFILGRSGSGKTRFCLDGIRSELADSGGGGSALILLVPEQATFQMEQALLEGEEGICGFHRVEVMSFDRLAREVLTAVSPPRLEVLSEFGKQVILRRLLQENAGELAIFGKSADRGGFAVELSRMISELRQYQKTPGMLKEQREEIIAGGDPVLRPLADKLGDLGLILEAYQEAISGNFIDPDDFLDRMSGCCGQAEIFTDAILWMDGFAGFTPQQYKVLRAMIGRVERSYITLNLDPESGEFMKAQNPAARLDEMDLFHPTLETYQKLKALLEKDGMEVVPPLLLPVDGQMPRFLANERLAMLERNLFERGGSNIAASPPPDKNADEDKGLVAVEAADRRCEVDAVVREIATLCRERNYRYREITVILREFSDYQDLLEAAFVDHGIPYFIDLCRSVSHHPLIELIRSALQVIISDFKSESVFDYLKTDLAPLTRDQVDALENYVLAHGINYGRWTCEKAWKYDDRALRKDDTGAADFQLDLGQVNECRLKATGPLVRLREALNDKGEDLSVRTITVELLGLLDTLEVPARLSQWLQAARESGDLDGAQVHQQVYGDLITMLDDLVGAIGDQVVSLADYGEILLAGLEQMTLQLIPPAIDQVLIGSIERSRQPNIRAAFVLGVNEGAFPRVSVPEAFFTDDQRNHLKDNEFELGPTSTEKLMHEHYLGYIALTRGRDYLWVSWPISDGHGKVLSRSRLIEQVIDAVDGEIELRRLEREPNWGNLDNINSPEQLGWQLAGAFSTLRSGGQVDPIWQQLYRSVQLRPEWLPIVQRSMAGIFWRNTAALDAAVVEKSVGHELAGSVSRLESFAACPFQHYARYGLGLRPRDELQLGALNLGSFYHSALCEIFYAMQRKGINWHNMEDGQLDGILQEVANKLTDDDEQIAELLEQSERNTYFLNDAIDRLGRFCRALRQAARAGNFEQSEAELAFGAGKKMRPLEMQLADGGRLILRGIIDRVDTYLPEGKAEGLMVIDYKSSSRAFPFTEFYYGLSLQLVSYLLVLMNNYTASGQGQKTPTAGLYMPIHTQGQSQKGAPPEEVLTEEKNQINRPHKANGLINGEWAFDLDGTVEAKNYSQYYNMYINKDSSPYGSKSTSVVTTDEMTALLDHGAFLLQTLSEQVLKGNVSVSPYRLGLKTPCTYCDFRSVCRFDFNSDSYRQLVNVDKKWILDHIDAK